MNISKTIAGLYIAVAACYGTTIPCNSGEDITTLTGANDCTSASIEFDYKNFSVGYSGFTNVTVSIIGEQEADGGLYDVLDFGIVTDPAVITNPNSGAYIYIRYDAIALNPFGIDKVYLENTQGFGEKVYEEVCTVNYDANYGSCPAGDVLGSIGAAPWYYAETSFAPQQQVSVQKWIALSDAHVEEVDNGVGTDAPEPVTLSLMGGALIGLAVLGKKLKGD